MSKARLSKVATLVRKYAGKHGGTSWQKNIERFLEAHSRGMIVCEDGKERTHEEWIKTLDPNLQASFIEMLEQQQDQNKK